MKNREILFRGKRVDNGERVMGDLLHSEVDFKQVSIIVDWSTKEVQHKVIPETVGQFTGLCDKNGVKIFEGDIVSFKRGIGNWTGEWITTKHIVSWDKTVSRFSLGTEAESLKFRSHPRYEYEVIGNINDNPELL